MGGTIEFLDHKNIDIDTKIIILSGLVQNVWSKTCFCNMVASLLSTNQDTVQNVILQR